MQLAMNLLRPFFRKSYSTLVSTVGASNNYTPYGCSALVRIHYDDYSVANWHIYATVYAEHTKVTNVKGRVTGVETKMLESGTWIRSLNYYDKFGRLLQTFRGNPEGGYNRISFAYDFAGNNTKKQTYHKKTSGSTAITLNEQFDHDHMGRPTFVKHGYNTSTLTTIAKYTYDDIGRTDIKELHQGYQDLDMQFNIRGWLTQMNDPDVSASNAKLFAFELYYNTVDEIFPLDEDGQFNGNVSGIRWRNNNSTRAAYAFKYDGLNRLTKADYGSGTSGGTITDYDKYEVDVSYDANGNISALTRENSSGGILDAFTYVYSGNRLSSLSGSSSYGYDGNGNTTYDGKRGIGVGYFEEIDLPGHYARGTDTVRYEYDATGLKWGKSATLGGNTSTMDYYGEFIYRDGTLDKVLTSEGYYDPTGADYHYHLKDHLGNTRMTIHYDGSSATAQVDQEIEYYPFGKMFSANNTAENKYLYNGKELQNEFFENYDYGARFYDPELGKWHSVDPKSEKFYYESPYCYVGNNPLIYIDTDGQVKFKLEAHFKMTTGILGLGVQALGFKKYFEGAKESQVSLNLSFDTDSKQLTFGAALSDKNVKGGELSGGVIYGFSETTEKETSNEAKAGYDFKENKFVAETESNPKKGKEAKEKKIEEGTLGIGTVTQTDGEPTKISVGLNPEVNLLLIGTGIGVNLSVEDDNKK